MSDWRTIDSAPKDGSGILVIDMGAEAPGAGMAWFENGQWSGDDPEVHYGDDCRKSSWPHPTHWMPLPPPLGSDRPAAPEIEPLSDGAILEIKGAIKATEYKYFGDYELSDEQQTAVNVLVAAAEMLIARATLSQQANEERA